MYQLGELLPGCVLLQGDLFRDDRGWFRRLHSASYDSAGIPSSFRQTGASYNRRRGTLRGLHFQSAPHLEVKLVQCLRGVVYDVMVDVRAGSPTYGRYAAAELSEENGHMMFASPGFAHGFLTLTDDCIVGYMISPDYYPEAAGGLWWNDPDLAIPWPETPVEISPRDQRLPTLKDHDPRLTALDPEPDHQGPVRNRAPTHL
ncbi:MAG TPA: dTDP-4-dehydrorhamnose 3,5-epimerase [Rhodopila sp.]|jgi:dTDP-4-dehydrorhamnose 3,5-epimerase